ncbi:MAG: ABC transporter ATP-binding protein [Verrucomicrobiales bacterium]
MKQGDSALPGTEVAVRIENLTKIYRAPWRRTPVRAVDALSLTVGRGEVYGLIGPNGSGKSTTMKALLGLVEPSAGRTSIFGIESARVESRSRVGFLPENPYFYKHLSGAETLAFYGRLCGMRGAPLRQRIGELLAMAGLEEAADRRLAGYSKGMLQRIGLAQALIQEPRLVILDEPTAGVDPSGSRAIRDLILGLKQRGISVMLCSHLLEQVQQVCDRVGIIFRGKLVREGRLEELVALENQTELVLEGAGEELVEEIRKLALAAGARVLRSGHPRTTLEELFLRETGGGETSGERSPDHVEGGRER